jgi:hypothetical protein
VFFGAVLGEARKTITKALSTDTENSQFLAAILRQ